MGDVCPICKQPYDTPAADLEPCIPPKDCLYCKVTFRSKNKKYCSVKCRRLYQRQRLMARPVKQCARVGCQFTTRASGRVYCSRECYRMATGRGGW